MRNGGSRLFERNSPRGQFNFLPSIRLQWNELRCFLRDEDRGNKLFASSLLPVLRGEHDNFALYPLPLFRVSSRAEAVFDLTLIRFLSDGDSLDTRNRSWQKREEVDYPSTSLSLPEINFLGWETRFVFESKHRLNLFIFRKLLSFRNPLNLKELNIIIVKI